MTERVSVTRQDGVADVRLDRPEKLNGLDAAMLEALVATGTARAEGRALPDLLRREPGQPANFAQRAAWVWAELPVPVIAAVHGACFGGGLQIALAADLRIVAPDAQLSVMEIRWGLVPDMTGTQTLRHLVGLDVAKELVFTGRIVSGVEAAALGLATRVSDAPREAAFADPAA